MSRADDQEFHDFVAKRMERWRRSAYFLCQDWHTADDIVSIAIAQLYRHWKTVRKADNPDAYAQRTLTRTWISESRRSWRQEYPSDQLPDQPASPPDRIADRESLAGLLQAIGPRQRAVVVLRFYFDYSAEQTAEVLRISVGTVKSQTARALSLLRVNS